MRRNITLHVVLLALTLLLLATPLLAQQPEPLDPMGVVPMVPAEALDRGCAEGRALYAQRKYAEALPLLDAYLKGAPNPQVIDEIAFQLGRCYYETRQYDLAATTFNWILRNCTTSRLVPEAGVQLYRCFIATQNTAGMAALWAEAPTRWGHTSFIGQLTELDFQEQLKTDPQVALQHVDRMLTSGLLTPAYLRKCLTLKFTYLEKSRPAQAVAAGVELLTALPDTLTPEELGVYAGFAPKLYKQLVQRGQADKAAAVHARLQTLAMQAGNPGGLVAQDRDAYWAALPARAALPEVRAAAEAITTAAGQDSAAVAVLAAARAYGLLVKGGQVAEAEALHATVQGRLTALDCAELAEADALAYAAVWFPAMEKTDPARACAALRPLCAALEATTSPQTLATVAGLAGRYYGLLFVGGQDAGAAAVHDWLRARLLAAAWPPVTAPPKGAAAPTEAAAVRELVAYTTALQRALWARSTAAGVTAPEVAVLQRRALAAWQVDPVATLPCLTTFLTESRAGSPASAGWYDTVAIVLAALPATCPGRSDAHLALAQVAHQAVLQQQATGEDTTALTALTARAEAAYRWVLATTPGEPAAAQALTGLVGLLETTARGAEVANLLETLGAAPTAAPIRAWLADWCFHQGTPEGYSRAVALYQTLLAAPASPEAPRPLWQFRLARSLEGSGRRAEARAAYQRVIDAYPASPCVVAALAKVAQLQEAQP